MFRKGPAAGLHLRLDLREAGAEAAVGAPQGRFGIGVQQARQAGSGPRSTATGGAVREGATGESGARNEAVAGLHRPDPAAQPARRNTSVPLVPPKPKLFFTATSIFISRAALAQ